MMYMMTPEQHAQIAEHYERLYAEIDLSEWDGKSAQSLRDTLAALKAMQPVSPCAWGWHGGDGRMRDCIAPDTHAILEGDYTVPLYTPTKD